MAAPSLEADLRAAREAAGVSIEQIQQETRIPADVIQRFEAGKLLTDEAFNEVYLKAFLRAYGDAVGLSSSRVLRAYEAALGGGYRGEMHPDYEPEPAPAPASRPQPPAAPGTAEPADEDRSPDEDLATEAPPVTEPASTPSAPSAAPAVGRAPAVAALSSTPEAREVPRPPEGPNESFPKRRVAPPAPVATRRSFDRSWGTIIGATAGVVVVIVAVLWLLFRDTTPEPVDVETVAAADTAQSGSAQSADTARAEPTLEAAGPGPRLALPIRVTVVAKGDGLQAFRVTEVPDDRRPYWMEPGTEQTFESSEGVILWGEGAEGMNPQEVTLRWQGFEWTPPSGQILRITARNGQRLLDSLQAAGARRAASPSPTAP